MKKISPLLLLLVVSTLLAGCLAGAQTPTPPPAPPPNPTAAPSATATAQPSPTLTTEPTSAPTAVLSPTHDPYASFTFYSTSDMHFASGPDNFTLDRYRGVLEAIQSLGPGLFMLTPGDITPAADTRWTIDQVLGKDYLWLPTPGNHDLRKFDQDWFHSYIPTQLSRLPGTVHTGPPGCPLTTYSYDIGQAHFIALNEFCDPASETHMDGAVVDPVYTWLKADLQANRLPLVFVYGHEPAYPQPDQDLNVARHLGESLDKYPVWRDRFWKLLVSHHVTAYINGHTHAFSSAQIDGVWQLDDGHSQGSGIIAFPSTFLRIQVDGATASYAAYQADAHDVYQLKASGSLTSP